MDAVDAAALEPELAARLGAGLAARLAALDGEFGGLLEREALLLVLAAEEGLLPAAAATAVPDGAPEALRDAAGVVERVSPTRTFRRRDGSVGFVCDVELRAPEGVLRLVLWDEAVRRVQGWQGRGARFTALAERTRAGGRELHSTRGTELGPA